MVTVIYVIVQVTVEEKIQASPDLILQCDAINEDSGGPDGKLIVVIILFLFVSLPSNYFNTR